MPNLIHALDVKPPLVCIGLCHPTVALCRHRLEALYEPLVCRKSLFLITFRYGVQFRSVPYNSVTVTLLVHCTAIKFIFNTVFCNIFCLASVLGTFQFDQEHIPKP